MGKKPGETGPIKRPRGVGAAFAKPPCPVCGVGTRRMRAAKWSVCESGHKLYKLQNR
jgi:hypothetical protein